LTGRICHERYGQNLAKKNRVIFGNKYPQETAGKSADPRYHFADAMIYEALTKYYTSRIGVLCQVSSLAISVTGIVHEILDNAIATVICSVAALTFIGWEWFPIWNYIYSASVGWVVADVVLTTLFVRGGGGWLKIPWGQEADLFKGKGIGYAVFLLGIIISPIVSSVITEVMLGGIGLAVTNMAATNSTTITPIEPMLHVIASNPNFFTLLLANCAVGILVFLDLNARFYKKS